MMNFALHNLSVCCIIAKPTKTQNILTTGFLNVIINTNPICASSNFFLALIPYTRPFFTRQSPTDFFP